MQEIIKGCFNKKGNSWCQLKDMDMFGGFPTFNVNGKSTYSTKYGAVLTLLFIIFTGVIFIWFGQKLSGTDAPNITYNFHYSEEDLSQDLAANDFNLYF
jgi:hypothetical protein